MKDPVQKIREDVVRAGMELVREGLVARTWGNISLRVDERTMAITPSGKKYEETTPEQIVLVDLVEGTYLGDVKPSGEKKLHIEIYRLRPEINAVIHTHQQKASTCAAARVSVPVPDRRHAKILGTETVACGGYALPGTKRLTRETVSALAAARAALLANHGAVCAGSDLREAFLVARTLETACADFIEKRVMEKTGTTRFSEKLMLDYYASRKGIIA